MRAAAWMVLCSLSLAAQPPVHNVSVDCCSFIDPVSGGSTTTVPVGTIVRWNWTNGTHSVTNGNPGDPLAGLVFNAPLSAANPTFQFTFNSAGTFPYHCVPHAPFMTGTVIVTQPATVTVNGAGCTGSNALVFTASATGLPVIGNPSFALNVSNGPANGIGLLFGSVGAQNPPVPVTPTCNLYLELNTFFAFLNAGITPIAVPLNGTGAGSLPFPVPVTFSPGSRLDVQWAYGDPGVTGGIVSSNALVLVFGN